MKLRPFRRLALRYTRLRYRRVPEPLPVWAEHGGVFWTWSVMELMQEATWRHLRPSVRYLALLQAARTADCTWCLDFGSALAGKAGLSKAQLLDLDDWRESPAYDDEERLAMELGIALSVTPVAVSDELVERCRERFGQKGLVELAAAIALENQRARFNKTFGLVAAGWSRVCATPVSLEDRRLAV